MCPFTYYLVSGSVQLCVSLLTFLLLSRHLAWALKIQDHPRSCIDSTLQELEQARSKEPLVMASQDFYRLFHGCRVHVDFDNSLQGL